MKKRSLITGLSAVSVLLLNTQASGQALEEVIVTAQKRAQNLQDVPIAVTALTSDELSDASIESQYTLPKITPNMRFTKISSFASVYLRGVGTQFANPGLESSVSVYFDDTYIPRAASGMFSFNDIERIEVLKGPQGTLYGRNATGGAIRIITPDPRDEFEAKVSLTAGSDSRLAYDGVLNIPLTDTLAFRIAARHDEQDGFTDNIFPGGRQSELEERDEDLVVAKLLFQPTDNLSFKLSGDYAHKFDTDGETFINLFDSPTEQLGLAFGGCGSTDFYNICTNQGVGDGTNEGAKTNVRAWGSTLRVDYDFGNAILSSISGYREHVEHNSADLDATGANLQQATGRPVTEQFTQEFQITGSFGDAIDYVTGIYYLEETSGYYFSLWGQGIDGSLGFPGASLGGDGEQEVESIAPYVQVDWRIADTLALTTGLRYTKEEKELNYNELVIGPVGPDGFAIQSLAARVPFPIVNEEFNELTPKITISWDASDDLMLYATYARGFKSGGLNLPAFGPVDTVEPEILDEFEIGWKMQGDRIRFNGATFYYKYDDIQIQITDQTTGGTRVVNAAKADVYGLEADLTWAATENLELGAGLGYLNTEYKDFIGDVYTPCLQTAGLPENTQTEIDGKAAAIAACTAQGGIGLALVGGQDLTGNELVNAPEWTTYVRAAYEQHLGDAGSIRYSAILNHRSRTYYDPGNVFTEDSLLLASANVTWRSANEKYFVSLFGENLTDEEYYVANSPQGTGGWKIPAPPRQVYVKGGISF